jgi:phosphoribosyl 1,2-cyclic phosphate phosphodiesterase
MAGKIGAEKTFLTHLSHQFGFHQNIQAELPGGVFVAFDGLKLEL